MLQWLNKGNKKRVNKLQKAKEVSPTTRLEDILNGYGSGMEPVAATYSFVKEFLNPQPDRYDMIYRYEHTLRVALWGKRIAEGEGWDSEPLVIACLLHDVGYPLCRDITEWKKHPAVGAELAERFLQKINYDAELTKSICKAVAIHDIVNDVPEDATPFELSVRDADDLDRFDVMRMCMLGKDDIGERSAGELIAVCDARLEALEANEKRVCGTGSAARLWKEELQVRKQLYIGLKEQMQGTFEMESYLQK